MRNKMFYAICQTRSDLFLYQDEEGQYFFSGFSSAAVLAESLVEAEYIREGLLHKEDSAIQEVELVFHRRGGPAAGLGALRPVRPPSRASRAITRAAA